MGHYHSEMYEDHRTKKEKELAAIKEKRKEELEKQLCKILKCTKKELKIVHEILKETWNYF